MTRPCTSRATGAIVSVACVLFISSPVDAQLLGDLSGGIGAVIEDGGEPVAVGEIALGFLFFEAEFGALSNAERCRQAAEPVDNCYDIMLGAGIRYRFLSDTTPVRPFVDVLGAGYWSGIGEEDTDFQYTYHALQVGGGVDARRPGSRHGMRLSVHYRRVYADPRRDQVRFLVSYVFALLR